MKDVVFIKGFFNPMLPSDSRPRLNQSAITVTVLHPDFSILIDVGMDAVARGGRILITGDGTTVGSGEDIKSVSEASDVVSMLEKNGFVDIQTGKQSPCKYINLLDMVSDKW